MGEKKRGREREIGIGRERYGEREIERKGERARNNVENVNGFKSGNGSVV